LNFNLFSRHKTGPTFEVIRPHSEESLPMGFFWVKAGEHKTIGFRCATWFAYDTHNRPVNDGKSVVYLAAWLTEHGMKTADELPTIVLTMQKADRTQQQIGSTNINRDRCTRRL